ncbi:MAG: hypothetical protein WDO56_13270 [Gammaproteobacteria bacterium]
MSSPDTSPHAVEQPVANSAQEDSPERNAGSRILSPGQRLTFSAEAPKLDRPQIEKVTAWKQGQVALDDMPLASAVVEMNRYSKVKLVVEHPAAGNVRVGGFFRMGDSASFAARRCFDLWARGDRATG